MTRATRSERIRSTGTAALGLAGLSVFLWSTPAAWSFIPGCPFTQLTGLLCAGCGSVRAWQELMHLHIVQALALNPYAVLIAPVIAAWMVWHCIRAITGKALAQPFISPWILWSFLALVLVITIARNLPFQQFEVRVIVSP
jgi:hypothetical protein